MLRRKPGMRQDKPEKPRRKFIIVGGFLFMGNFSPSDQKTCLGYAPGREWRDPYLLTDSLHSQAKSAGYKSGWVPVAQYVAYIKSHPCMKEQWESEFRKAGHR